MSPKYYCCIYIYSAPGWGRVVSEVFEALRRSGGLEPRLVQPSPALLAAREGVNRLIESWDDGLADRLAADNFFLDASRETRRGQLDELRARHGSCRPAGEIDAENWLRGRWRLTRDRGQVEGSITLAPTQPPRVQHLETTSALPLAGRLAAVASQLAERLGTTPAAPATELWAPDADVDKANLLLAAAGAWGSCRLGDVQRGGGDAGLLRTLTREGLIPVVAPLGADREGRTYNVNANTAAGAIAAALGAEKLILLTDVDGVKDKSGRRIGQLAEPEVKKLVAEGTIEGGMIPKVECCLDALRGGVNRAHIVDGRILHAILLEVFTDGCVGTLLTLRQTQPRGPRGKQAASKAR